MPSRRILRVMSRVYIVLVEYPNPLYSYTQTVGLNEIVWC